MKTVDNGNYFVENRAARVDNFAQTVDNCRFSVDKPVNLGVSRCIALGSRRSTGQGERVSN